METFGEVLRRLKGPLSLRELGRRAHISPAYLSRLLSDTRPPPKAQLIDALDAALGGSGELRRFVTQTITWPVADTAWQRMDNEQLANALLGEAPTAETATELAHEWLIAEAPQEYELRSGRRIGVDLVDTIERRVQQLRLLDDHLGGAETHPLLSVELIQTAGVLRNAAYTEQLGRRLLVAVGELCQLAGYVYTDAGRLRDAERLYLAGMRAAHAGGDTAVAANCLSSLAYQVANSGNPRRAAVLARSAWAGGSRAGTATTRALLLERVAWAHAMVRDDVAASRALHTVDELFAGRHTEEDPPWAYWVTPDEVQIMAGRVWTELGRPLKAVPILQRIVKMYGDDRPRETALYTTWLAEALIQAHEPDQAAALLTESVEVARRSASVRAISRFDRVRELLHPYRTSAVETFEEAWSFARAAVQEPDCKTASRAEPKDELINRIPALPSA